MMFSISLRGIVLFGVFFRVSELFLLFLAAGGITAIAKRRGGQEWLWGSIAFIGYVAVKIGVIVAGLFSGPAYEEGGTNVFPLLSAVAWVAATWLAARFWLGRSKEKPGQKWNCPSCNYLNMEDAVVCEACSTPYKDPAERGGLPL